MVAREMVRPLTAAVRQVWRRRLLARARPVPDLAGRPVVVLAPHPDDETLGCGGLVVRAMASGASVRVVVVADGRHRKNPSDDLADVRAAEVRDAAAALGLPDAALAMWALPNGRLRDHLPELRDRLRELVTGTHSLVLAPSRDDVHADHLAVHEAVRDVVEADAGLELWEYPVWAWTRWPWRPVPDARRRARARLTAPFTSPPGSPVVLRLDDEERRRKTSAIGRYDSQFGPGAGPRRAAGLALLQALPDDVEVFFRTRIPGPQASSEQVRVLNLHCDLRLGGGQVHVLRHLSTLQDGFVHHVAGLTEPDDMLGDFARAGLHPVALHSRGGLDSLRVVAALVRIIRQERIDVVHTNTRPDRLVGWVAALLTRRPVVDTLRSEFAARRHRDAGRPPLPRQLPRLLGEDALRPLVVRHVVAISEDVARTWRRSVVGTTAERIPVSVVHAGVPLQLFAHDDRRRRSRVREGLGVPPDAPLLVTVARLDRGKGLHHLVPVVRTLRDGGVDAYAVVAGEGPYRDDLESAITSAGLADRLLLPGRRDDVPELLAAADVFVFPSHSEGFGVAVLEAVAAGLPVVAFDLPVLHETVVSGTTGVLVPVGDADALADAVAELVADPARARAMGEAGRRRAADRFDLRACADRLGAVYRQSASTRGDRPSPAISALISGR